VYAQTNRNDPREQRFLDSLPDRDFNYAARHRPVDKCDLCGMKVSYSWIPRVNHERPIISSAFPSVITLARNVRSPNASRTSFRSLY